MEKITVEEVKSSFSFSIPIQVRFSDIDGYMHVNNGIYFNYFEHARAAYLHQVCDWDIMVTGTVVANVNIDYRSPLHIKDQPEVFVRCVKVGKSSFVLEQVLLGQTNNGDWRVFAQAMTTMVSVDMRSMKPVPVPKAYALKMQGEAL
jgi:acyl-CoA thioester hydrolase